MWFWIVILILSIGGIVLAIRESYVAIAPVVQVTDHQLFNPITKRGTSQIRKRVVFDKTKCAAIETEKLLDSPTKVLTLKNLFIDNMGDIDHNAIVTISFTFENGIVRPITMIRRKPYLFRNNDYRNIAVDLSLLPFVEASSDNNGVNIISEIPLTEVTINQKESSMPFFDEKIRGEVCIGLTES